MTFAKPDFRTRKTSLVLVLLVGALTGCFGGGGDGDGAGAGTGGGAGTTGGSAGSGGGAGTSGGGAGTSGGGAGTSGGGGNTSSGGACLAQSEVDVLVSARNLSNGSPVYRMELDDTHLYYATVDTLYRVALSGGEPEELHYDEFAFAVKFWVRDDDLILLERTDTVVSMPKAGGTKTELLKLPYRVSTSLDGRVDMVVEGDMLWAKNQELSFGGSKPDLIRFFEANLDTGDVRIIHEGDLGKNSLFRKQGDALYTSSRDPAATGDASDPSVTIPDLLYRLPLDGSDPEPLDLGELRVALNVFGSDDDHLFFFGTNRNDIKDHGIYRVPITGGEPERLVDTVVLFNLTFEHELTETRHILRSLDDFYAVDRSGGAARKLFCMRDGVHAAAATDDAVWVALLDKDKKTSIVKVPIE